MGLNSQHWRLQARSVNIALRFFKKEWRLAQNAKSFPLHSTTLRRRRAPSIQAPFVTRPLSAARCPSLLSSAWVAVHWRP